MKILTIIGLVSFFLVNTALAEYVGSLDKMNKLFGVVIEDKKIKASEEEDKKIKALAECIMLLQPRQTPYVANFIALHILNQSNANNIDPDLITALMYVESQFNPMATSHMDAIGLMQIRWVSWKDEAILKNNGVNERTKLYHIDHNIKCGVLILSAFLKEAKGNIGAALFRYNTGGKLSTESWRIEYNNKILYYFFKIREHQLYGIPLDPIQVPVKKIDTKEVK
jgi:hypothetical protein